jgi:hypothetical protein
LTDKASGSIFMATKLSGLIASTLSSTPVLQKKKQKKKNPQVFVNAQVL